MKITISTPDGSVVGPVDVPEEMELENFLALTQGEIPALANVPIRQLCLLHSGRLINDFGKNLKDCGLSDGDLVMVSLVPTPRQPQAGAAASANPFGIDFSSIQVPGGPARRNRQPNQNVASALANAAGLPALPDPGALRQMLLADPNAATRLRERNPDLADAINDPEAFARVFNEQMSSRQAAALRRLQMLRDNPFDPEVQRMIEEEIQQQEIESHMETAMEHMPETFGMVTMLYIRCLVNGHEVKAFVDSGAQATIMSEPCARRCNITRLIDRRFSGIARGVGTSKIVGRIHMAQLQIENDFLPTAFNVLEDAGVEMLFGLDMLKRHQCVIDLQRNVLVIGTTGTTTPFLPESELPEARHHGPTSPGAEDRQLAEAIERSVDEAEAAALSASVAASNVRRSTSSPAPPSVPSGDGAPSDHGAGSSGGAAAATFTAPNEAVESLVAMGFRREDAARELAKAGGDINKAAMALIAVSLPPPPAKKK